MEFSPSSSDSVCDSRSSSNASIVTYSEDSHLLRSRRGDGWVDPLLPEQVEKQKSFPKSVFFIVGNEFCERFSYYGMRTVLYLYLIDQLNLSSSTATVVYHAFVVLCYFSPIFGAMLADSLLGKFKTILYVSILYALGNIVLSMAATPPLNFPMLPISILGLILIALGTGGIKPCVSAFGGDQFDADQVRARERFFFIFYFSINAGSLISTYVTPILRGSVQCFGSKTCFPLAFGLPAAIMVVSILFFVCGKPLYRIIPPQGNLVAKVVKCIGCALKNKSKSNSVKKEHWLDYAEDKFDKTFISEIRATLKVMYLFIPLPFFWALFDQQGSTWTLQATQMNGRLSSSYVIQPDQMQVVNPLLILVFIPIFDFAVYPSLAKCNILTKPLKRMFAGGLLAVLSFVVAAFIQIKIEQTLPMNLSPGHIDITFMNSMPCDTQINALYFNNVTIARATSFEVNANIGNINAMELSIQPRCASLQEKNFTLNVTSNSFYSVFLTNTDEEIKMIQLQKNQEKPKDGSASVRVAFNLALVSTDDVIQFKDHKNEYILKINEPQGSTEYLSVISATYEIWLQNNGTSTNTLLGNIDAENGGVYTVALAIDPATKNISSFQVSTDVLPNSLHLLWQVPQYIVITAGEIMFSITGLAFSYSQAPVSMKSVLTAAWLLTTAFGNLIVIIIEEIPFGSKQSTMFFIYAGAMLVVMVIFALMCRSYEYVNTADTKENTTTPNEKENFDNILSKETNASSM